MDKILSISKRRGFVFQSSEIYGGLGSTWDYGPLGVELKRHVKEAWWRSVVLDRDDMVGLDAAILMHPQVWVASGHVENFTDPLVECRSCNRRFRLDHLAEAAGMELDQADSAKSLEVLACPECGGELGDPRQFNLMFKTFMGPVEDTASEVHLRPETAQGIFVNFANVVNSTRKKLPFGIAQIGKAFRNEITPGNFTFRTREFEQMEIEYFVKPGTDEEWLQRWVQSRLDWYVEYGIRRENLRLRQHGSDELAHYAKDCYDIEYRFPWGWAELEGIASRTDYDLRQHAEHSGQDLTYFDEETKSRYFPYVVEPSGGLDRGVLAFWLDSYDEEPDGEAVRVVCRLHRKLAPVTVAVLPLSRNAKLVPAAQDVHARLRRHFTTQYDDAQGIGRRYRRQDEIGTPYCVTVDFDSLEDHQVTIRDRDTMHQSRIPIDELVSVLQDKVEHGW
ncbi:MAG TPA: glycine--tRNA ligase [Dehalococcoidia bacterium]|jgi:glycyl-tRNA synthetase|nr:glycine--tRNA ligase [Chloroflexota bacterium]HIM49826.1 glycine--tRNA ligase [Dehalococcoidia bacterium]|tara:strand:- start:1122 stop:2465 length:1344 start_codon:yes stop_codon:yes gene_type:complete